MRFYSESAVDEQSVFYESNGGRWPTGNPYALFLRLLSDTKYENMQHFWSVESYEDCELLPKCFFKKNVHLVIHQGTEYLRALATSKYLINDSTFPSYFIKRPEQIYVNTWHGTPMKRMGYDMDGGAIGSGNVVRNFLHADYLLSANAVMTKMYLDSFKLDGIYPGTILEEGYPCSDLPTNVSREVLVGRLSQAGIDIDISKKVIIYAPTWRASDESNESITPLGNAEALLRTKKELEALLDDRSYQIIVKPHPFVYSAIMNDSKYLRKFIPPIFDANELMGIADVLITDFSSIAFDWLCLDKPMCFFVPDLLDYQNYRGLEFDIDKLPGPNTANLDEIADYIKGTEIGVDNYTKKRKNLLQELRFRDDGHVCERIIDIVIGGNFSSRRVKVSRTKKRMLLAGGSANINGISRAFISLLRQLDYSKWDVTVFIARGNADYNSYLSEIPKEARVISKVGYIAATRHEEALRETYDTLEIKSSILKKAYPEIVFAREAMRCFGDASFDCAIDFNGYERVQAAMISQIRAETKCIWLHSDIRAEIMTRADMHRNSLKRNISIYPRFDRIISCAKEVADINRKNLATPETSERFFYARNFIDVKRIEEGLNAEVFLFDDATYYSLGTADSYADCVLRALPDRNKTTFVTVGRLSPEKNQVALLRAFSRIVKEHKDVFLYLLGDGPLRSVIEETIKEEGLSDFVRLTGNVENPFIFMGNADCFILPSIYEGHSLVVNEARVCGLPIVVSNFDTVDNVSINNGQLIIEPTIDGIYQGMLSFLAGKVPCVDYDAEHENSDIMKEFERAIGQG